MSDESPPTAHRSKAKRTGLGRGLGALIPEQSSPAPDRTSSELAITEISPNPYQPRLLLDETELEELAASIRAHGIIQPIVVAEKEQGDGYHLIAGERRWRAAALAGLERVPCIVKHVTSQQMLEIALVENVVRSDLSPLEEAQAYQQLIEEFGLTQQDVATRVGRARVTIANTLRLLAAPDRVKEALTVGEITEGHARALLSLPDSFDQLYLLDEAIQRQWSVRQTEAAVRNRLAQPEQVKPRAIHREEAVALDRLSRRMEQRLQTSVKIRSGENGNGSITIAFSDGEQLADLVDRITGEDVF